MEVAVVAPASDLSLKEWVAADESKAREEAQRRAVEAAEAGAVVGKVVDARVGDPDPVTAVRDALQTFPADELVVVTRPPDEAAWLEKAAVAGELEQFGLPVTHLVDDDATDSVHTRGSVASSRRVSVGFFAANLVLVLMLFAVILIGVAFAFYYGLR